MRRGSGLALLGVLAACAGEGVPGSDLVVHGRVAAVTTRREGGLLISRARLEPIATLAGSAVADVDVEFVGGTLDGLGQILSGGVSLTPGEEVVVTLVPAHGAYRAKEGALSKYRVVRPSFGEPMAVRDGTGEAPVTLAALLGAGGPGGPVETPPSSSPSRPDAKLTPYVRTTTAAAVPGCGGPAVPLAWFTHNVPYVIDAAGSEDIPDDSDLAAVRAAAETWQAVPCSDLQLSFVGAVTGESPGFVFGGENTNLVTWTNEWTQSSRAIAVTLTTFRCTDGEILDADIVFNEQNFAFTSAPQPGEMRADVQNVATHELGHFLGFDHNPDPESTMFATSSLGETAKRTLTHGDELGLCDVYLPGAGVIGRDPRPVIRHPRGPLPPVQGGGGGTDTCGDGVCTGSETARTCPLDCAVICGDGTCEAFETCVDCPGDCGACFCGDGLCTHGECAACAADCPFGCFCSDVCVVGPPQDPSCGPCQTTVCAADPSCCEAFWHPGCVSAANDLCGAGCPDLCGDGFCQPGEEISCPTDCHFSFCGDGVCDPGEDCQLCPNDCGPCFCGDGACTGGECSTCTGDCPTGCDCFDVCLEGPPQDPSCGTCQADVCAADSSCCEIFWHFGCVQLANQVCGLACPSHD